MEPVGRLLGGYRGGDELRASIRGGSGGFVVRPAPEDEVDVVIDAAREAIDAGRSVLVIVPQAEPIPETARRLLDVYGDRAVSLIGGSKAERYRTWVDLAVGDADLVVGTRPAVFAPIPRLGLVWVVRESHAAHREDRAPYYHARDVALARARLAGATCVLAASCPSSEAAALALPEVIPSMRRWPQVEVVRPGTEGRAPRLVQALRGARRAFVFAPVPGYGVAQVCRSCGEPAACRACGGSLRLSEGAIRCVVCGASGRCAACGGTAFGIRRGGAERVEEWIGGVASVPARSMPTRPRLPRPGGEILIGGPEAVRDLGPASLDLVAILDADLAARRPGLAAQERALAVWMEAVGWARPAGRAIVQATRPSDPAVQALVRGNPDRFHARERERRAAAGFPVGAPVFRVTGDERLEAAVASVSAITALISSLGGRTVCLLALEPGQVPAFGAEMRALAVTGVVERVEAEPHL